MQFESEESCFEHLDSIGKRFYEGPGYGCTGTFDNILCFEATPANYTLKLPCPKMAGVFDSSNTTFLYKTCLPDGVWEGFNKTLAHSGYTNYGPCLADVPPPTDDLLLKILLLVEFIGITLSTLCLLFSLSIFIHHKSLRCKRTKIHLNLFVAILGQSLFRLVFFLDRALYDKEKSKSLAYVSLMMQINHSLCPISTAFLEYFQSCTFMWMLCEGIYLNVLLTYSIFDNNNKAIIGAFYFIGWGLPAITVSSWFTTMSSSFGFDEVCWFGYFEKAIYWIIQGPILTALIINIFCLANVIRILTNKLREERARGNASNDSVEQIKKSFKAAALLLPLLGVTHLFEMSHWEPENWYLKLIYSVLNCFLVFYNGVFLSILYCFMNNEVKIVLKRYWLSKFSEMKIVKCMTKGKRKNNQTEAEQSRLMNTNTEVINLNDMSNTKIYAETE